MTVVCIDNEHTWRNVLTLNKEYEVINVYPDPYEYQEMYDIMCDDGKIRPYRANRFK